MQLAPVAIGTYNRLEHLRRTVKSLAGNTLAPHSDLFVFSDAAKPGDEKQVEAVRDYLDTVEGFRSVTVLKRTENNRVANNRGGVKRLLHEYGRAIFLEDDNETAPGFLQFMNQALEHYQDNPRVFSVCGYTPVLKRAASVPGSAIALRRIMPWGVGYWRDRFLNVPAIRPRDYLAFVRQSEQRRRMTEHYGSRMLQLIRMEVLGWRDGFDTKGNLHGFRHNLFAIHPKRSLVHNIGNDGSGVHCIETRKFDTPLWDKTTDFELAAKPDIDADVDAEFVQFMEDDVRQVADQTVDAIMQGIHTDKVAIWGTEILTDLILYRCRQRGVRVTAIIQGQGPALGHLWGIEVMSLDEYARRGGGTLVLASLNSAAAMQRQAQRYAPTIVTVRLPTTQPEANGPRPDNRTCRA